MDKETQEGMKNLDVTARVGDLVEGASTKANAEFSEEEQSVKATVKTEK